MHKTTGHFATGQGSRYLQQLCKHFAHKLEVSFDAARGTIHFPFGDVDLTADDAGLNVFISAASDADVERGRKVVESHLERFAFREDFVGINWRDPQSSA